MTGVQTCALPIFIKYIVSQSRYAITQTYKSRAYAIDDFDGKYGKMESYHLTDILASYTYKNYEFFAKVNNIFDEKNGVFASDGNSIGVNPVNFERTFMVGFNARF